MYFHPTTHSMLGEYDSRLPLARYMWQVTWHLGSLLFWAQFTHTQLASFLFQCLSHEDRYHGQALSCLAGLGLGVVCASPVRCTLQCLSMQLVLLHSTTKSRWALQMLSCICQILTTIKIEMQLVIALDNQVHGWFLPLLLVSIKS